MTLTLDEMIPWLEARATREEGSDCLVWKLSLNYNQPQARYKGIPLNVRRVLYELRTGKTAPKKWAVVCGCKTEGCVNPDHLKVSPRSKILAGRPKTAQERINSMHASRARSRLTPEIIEDIRRGPGSVREKAQRYGMSPRYVWDLQQQRYWKDYSNPFSGLIAANSSRRDAA